MIAKLPLPLLPALSFTLPSLPALPRWLRHQRMGVDELKSMSDHELRDLGLGRSEVDWALENGREN